MGKGILLHFKVGGKYMHKKLAVFAILFSIGFAFWRR